MIACALGALGLRRQRRWGPAHDAASAMIFVGLFDITFNVQAGTYSSLPWRNLAPELFVIALCTLFPRLPPGAARSGVGVESPRGASPTRS